MRIQEILGKLISTVVLVLVCWGGGLVILMAPQSGDDYFSTMLGLGMIGLGLLVGGVGTVIVAGVVLDARMRRREAAVHITPRSGPLAAPPSWGMGKVGRPAQASSLDEATHPRGGGGVRIMKVRGSNWDAPLIVIGLLIWTAAFVWFLAPR